MEAQIQTCIVILKTKVAVTWINTSHIPTVRAPHSKTAFHKCNVCFSMKSFYQTDDLLESGKHDDTSWGHYKQFIGSYQKLIGLIHLFKASCIVGTQWIGGIFTGIYDLYYHYFFSPGIRQPCVIFNGHISFSRTSPLLCKCKFPASHSLTALRRRMKFLCYFNRWQWQNVFLMLQVTHLLLSWGPRGLWGSILLLSIYWEAIFGLKTLVHSAWSTSWTTGDLLFAHPVTHLWTSAWTVL